MVSPIMQAVNLTHYVISTTLEGLTGNKLDVLLGPYLKCGLVMSTYDQEWKWPGSHEFIIELAKRAPLDILPLACNLLLSNSDLHKHLLSPCLKLLE